MNGNGGGSSTRGTDPTYKEWKLVLTCHKDSEISISRTDPTYKEWKQKLEDLLQELQGTARILPTRNGNPCIA